MNSMPCLTALMGITPTTGLQLSEYITSQLGKLSHVFICVWDHNFYDNHEDQRILHQWSNPVKLRLFLLSNETCFREEMERNKMAKKNVYPTILILLPKFQMPNCSLLIKIYENLFSKEVSTFMENHIKQN